MAFTSALMFNGQPGTLYDASEAHPAPIRFFSSRARSLRMLGTERSNVEMMWVDPADGVTPGMIILDTTAAKYYLVIKTETDAVLVQSATALVPLNVLLFSSVISGNSYAPAGGQTPNVYGDYTGGLVATPKTIRPIFEFSSDIFDVDTAGALPDGTVRLITAIGSPVAMNDEYSISGKLWRVQQRDPAWAAGSQFGLDIILREIKPQQKQVT